MSVNSSVRTATAIADPNQPANTLVVNSDGSINIRSVGLLVTTQSGTAYTFVIADANNFVQFTNGSAVTATIPPNSTAAFPVGTVIAAEQAGAGQVTATAGAGVTVN